MDADTQEELGLLTTQIKDAVDTATAEFITGKRSLDDWDKFASQLDGLGAQTVVDDYNAAHEAFTK